MPAKSISVLLPHRIRRYTCGNPIGRTADIWDWDELGMPTVAILQAYDAVVIDESWYFDTTQRDTLGTWLSTASGSLNQIIMMGRDMSYGSSARAWMEQYTGTAYVKGCGSRNSERYSTAQRRVCDRRSALLTVWIGC